MKTYQNPELSIEVLDELDILCYSQEDAGAGDSINFGQSQS